MGASVRFRATLDTGLVALGDPRVTPISGQLVLEQANLEVTGIARQRDGFETLSLTTDSTRHPELTPADVSAIWYRSGSLTAHAFGSAWAYDDIARVWRERGPFVRLDLRMRRWSRRRDLFIAVGDMVDVAPVGGSLLAAISITGTARTEFQAVDENGTERLRSETTSGANYRVTALRNSVLVTRRGTTDIEVTPWIPTGATVLDPATSVYTAALATPASNIYDVVAGPAPDSTAYVFAIVTGTTALRVNRLRADGVIIDTATVGGGNQSPLAIGAPRDPTEGVVTVHQVTASSDIVCTFWTPTLAVSATVTVVAAATTATRVSVTRDPLNGDAIVTVETDPIPATWRHVCTTYRVTSTTSTVIATQRGAQIAAHGFGHNQSVYLWLHFEDIGLLPSGDPSLNRARVLFDAIKGAVVGRAWDTGLAFAPTREMVPRSQGDDAVGWYTGAGFNADGVEFGSGYAHLTVPPLGLLPARYNEAAIAPGPGEPWLDDGANWVELGYHVRPEIVTIAPIVGGGSFAAGVYQVTATYRWEDRAGRTYESGIAIPQSVTLAANDRISVEVTTLRLTERNTVSALDSYVSLQLFVTAANGLRFFEANLAVNDPTVDFLAFTVDAPLVTSVPIYTDGGILSNDPQVSTDFAVIADDRFWGLNPERDTVAAFGKLALEGRGIERSPVLALELPTGQDVRSVREFDGGLFVFGRRDVFALSLGGPNNAFFGTYSRPIPIPGDLGPTRHETIAEVSQGLWYISPEGPRLVIAGQQVSDVSEVLSRVWRIDKPAVTQVGYLPDPGLAICAAGEPKTYQWWNDSNRWSAETAISVAAIASECGEPRAYLDRAFGAIWRETRGVIVDDSRPIRLQLATAWISLDAADLLFASLWINVWGQWLAAHDLELSFAWDYEPFYRDTIRRRPFVRAGTVGGLAAVGDGPGLGQIADSTNNDYPDSLYDRYHVPADLLPTRYAVSVRVTLIPDAGVTERVAELHAISIQGERASGRATIPFVTTTTLA